MVTYDARPSSYTQMTTMAEWEAFLQACGIFDGIDGTTSFVPSLDTGGRNAVVSAGSCVIKGQLWRADAPVSTAIPAASAQNRVDMLVLQLNRAASTSPAILQPVVVAGASGSTNPPALTQNASGIWQIPVATWTSTSAGALTGLTDIRQLSGRTVVSMTSTYHPSPVHPRLGFEVDSGKVLFWNGTTWSSPQLITQTDPTDLTNNNLGGPQRISAIYNIPANDMKAGTVFEIDVPWTCQMQGQTLQLGLSVDGAAAFAVSETIGAAIVTPGVGLNGWTKVSVQCQSSGAGGTALLACYGMVRQNASNVLFSNSAVMCARPQDAAAFDTTVAHNIRINTLWGGSAAGQTVTGYGSKCVRLGP